jgi:beta-glucosidase
MHTNRLHMKKFFLPAAILIFSARISLNAQAPGSQKFLWGVASASYQVEGAYQADGKGVSNWDVYTNQYQVTRMMTGEVQTGNVSINEYDRTQYLKDIALMKQLGVSSYRFSISWARLLPEGTGAVNEKGVKHYDELIDALLASGIEPMITLFHWDLPQVLQEQGGWMNPKSVKWFEDYANLIFDRYGKKVNMFITFNEPYVDNFIITPIIENGIAQKYPPFPLSAEQQADRATAAHHVLLANATAIRDYHQKKMGGRIGITLSLAPKIPVNPDDPADVKAAVIADGMENRLYLDPLFRGKYPEDILAMYQQYNKNLNPGAADYALFAANKPDFLGVNFYAPDYIKADPGMAFGVPFMSQNTDSVKMFNGPVRPEYLYKLLMRIKEDYNNPVMIITENGAGFGSADDSLVNHQIHDAYRMDYIKRHIDTALAARKDGANLQGYTVWSMFDNFEWVFGYNRRFGIVYVDFKTQERIPKQSFYMYRDIIRSYRKK